jgi:hypothetical protein
MNEPLEKTVLEDRIKASLEESARNLDADTQQRLNAIRRAALNQPAKDKWFKANWLKLNGWIPATGLVFCSVIAMLIILPSHQTKQIGELPDQTAMLELLDNPDELDALSDPDFLMWVEEVNSEDGAAHAV